jgi:hypothetical protein
VTRPLHTRQDLRNAGQPQSRAACGSVLVSIATEWAARERSLFYLQTATSSFAAAKDHQQSYPDHVEERWRRLQLGGLRTRISCSPRCSGVLRLRACLCWPSPTSRPCSWRTGPPVSSTLEACQARN